jgi:hypothetical protein
VRSTSRIELADRVLDSGASACGDCHLSASPPPVVIAAGRRVMLALVALPRQLIAVWRAVSGRSAASERSSRNADD